MAGHFDKDGTYFDDATGKPVKGTPSPDGGATYANGDVFTKDQLMAGRAAAPGYHPFTQDPNHSDWPLGDQIASGLGFRPTLADPGAPGAFLDTTNADTERDRTKGMLASLQQQAATGAGAWEGALRQNTQKAMGAEQALGQSTPGVGIGDQLRGISNAQAASSQQAAGQANILRAKQQLGANSMFGAALGQTEDQQIDEASRKAAALQNTRAANDASKTTAAKTAENTSGGTAQSFMSDGGEVPGKPQVFGDDEKNDTVPAWLSPGEVVLPRSVANDPQAAAEFVRSLQMKGARHFADGGSTGTYNEPGSSLPLFQTFLPHVGQAMAQPKAQAASTANGAMLDTADYDSMTPMYNQLEQNYQQQASGAGPSVAPQQAQNSTDDMIGDSMRGSAGARGAGANAAFVNSLSNTARGLQHGAGEGAMTAQGEQQAGQKGYLNATLSQAERNLQLSQAQQQAAFRNTEMNMGLDLAQQQALRGMIGGMGQAGAAYAGAGKGRGYDPSTDNPYGAGGGAPDYQDPNVLNTQPEGEGSSPDDWDSGGFAHGGVIGDDEKKRASAFLKSLRRSA